MRLSRLFRHLRRQDGITLVMAIGILGVLTLSGTTMIYYSDSNARSAQYSKANASAYDLAEAGINEIMAVLDNPNNNALDSTLLPQTTHTYSTGTVTWSGTLIPNVNGNSTWSVTSTGRIANPTGARNLVTRTLSAKIPVVPIFTQPLTNPAWNYILARATGTPGGCDMTVTNSVVISSPLYVAGNLCLQNTSSITGGPLTVMGNTTLTQSANSVGSSSSPVNSVAIGGSCQWKNNSVYSPCQARAETNIWASSFSTSPTAQAPPNADWDGWYRNSMPGPNYGCVNPTGPVPTFDTGSAPVRDNSVTTVQNLTPSTSYTCKTAGGELSWNATTKVLTLKGVVFIDGSATVANGMVNTFTGEGALYLSGTLLIKNSKLCAAVANGDCTTQGWDPSVSNIAFVVNGVAGSTAPMNQVPVGDSVQLVSARAQGAIFATGKIDIATTAQFDGPLDGSTVILGQSTTTSWPGFTFVPIGLPGNDTVHAQPQPPQLYAG